jgi:hypothetical protein
MTAAAAAPTAPLSLFNRRSGVGCIANRHTVRWCGSQSRHAEEPKDQGHQRCYKQSLHQVASHSC